MSSVDTDINSIHLGGSGNNYITFHISRPASRVNSRPATPSVPMSAFVFPPEHFFHLPSPGEASRSQTPANASINPTSPDDVYNIAQATPVGDLFDHHFNTPEFLSEVGATLIAMETLINPKQQSTPTTQLENVPLNDIEPTVDLDAALRTLTQGRVTKKFQDPKSPVEHGKGKRLPSPSRYCDGCSKRLSSRSSKSIAGKGLNGDSHNDKNALTDTEYLHEAADTPVNNSTVDNESGLYESSAEEESTTDNGSSEAVAPDPTPSGKDFDFPPTPGAPDDRLIPLVFGWEYLQGNE